MDSSVTIIGVFAGISLASYAFVALFLGWSKRNNIVDVPNHRSSHNAPTPKGGGVAIATLSLVGFAIVTATMFTNDLPIRGAIAYVGCAALIAVISWFDDLRELSAKARFASHATGSIFAILTLGYFDAITLPFVGVVNIGWLGIPLTFIWIVGLTNIYNFMDGIDGLAGMQSVIAAFGWSIIGLLSGEPIILYLSIFIAASSVGFLWHNWHPANIFMGDVGSAFLGYTFAVLPLMYYRTTDSAVALPIGIFLLFIFLFDGIFTIIRRLRNRENIFEAHRSHLYQRLNIAGQSHDQITSLYLLLAFVGFAAAITIFIYAPNIIALATVCLGLACFGLWYFVQLYESNQAKKEHTLTSEDSIFDIFLSHFTSPEGTVPRNRYFFIFDTLSLAILPTIALILRIDTFPIPESYLFPIVGYTVIALAIRLILFYAFGLYRRYWRYASVDDLAQIVSVVFLATAIVTTVYLTVRVFVGLPFPFPRSLPIIDGVLTLIAVGGSRYAARFIFYHQNKVNANGGKRVLVMGAGNSGSMIVREIQRNPRLGLSIVGFLDDSEDKQQMRIQGIPVLGTHSDLAYIASKYRAEQLIIAMPSAPGDVIRKIIDLSEKAGITTKIVPSFHEFLNNGFKLNQLRDVAIEDLLRRSSVSTNQESVRDLLKGKRVLITGGGGSIGSELCRQIWRCEPAHLILLGHGENSIFDIHNELRRLNGPTIVSAVIADIRFAERIQSIFQLHKPEIVFHAAAHKHVPLMESNPVEAIANNVFGTQNVLNASLATGIERFVMISTDKAVNPTSIMGASKRIAELLVHRAAKESQRPFVAVRFGNVLGSRGSVIWTFKKQIAAGGPVTVTHPDITRFFMTIPEASQLVLQAAVMGTGEEVFVLDMGEPIKIVDLAKDMIELSGLRVGADVDIKFSGLRPGEKLYEELFIPGELYDRTANEKIFLADNASQFVKSELDVLLAELRVAMESESKQAIMLAIAKIIPEFNPPAWQKKDSPATKTMSKSESTQLKLAKNTS